MGASPRRKGNTDIVGGPQHGPDMLSSASAEVHDRGDAARPGAVLTCRGPRCDGYTWVYRGAKLDAVERSGGKVRRYTSCPGCQNPSVPITLDRPVPAGKRITP